MTVHYLPHFFLNWNWPKHSSNSISTSFLLKSSRKRYGFSLSHFIFHVWSVLFLILWVCCCHYALKNITLVQGFALSKWVFIDWELVFLTLLLVFIWSLGSVLCYMIVVVSFISCLWYYVTLFVIWILVMLNAHLILSY